MKYLFLLPAFLILFHTILYSQGCLPEGIVISTQEQIDNFQVNYPGCTEIEGDVNIMQGAITNLNGLSVLTSIGGHLQFYWVPLLNLSGMENLTSIGDYLYIGKAHSLQNLNGLENLTAIGGSLYIENNNNLTSLTGVDNLTSISQHLSVGKNILLASLDGFCNLTSIGGFINIWSNNSLTSLNGLQNVDGLSIAGLEIKLNSLLSSCNIQSICDYLANPNGTIVIHDNAPGCNSPEEVEQACLKENTSKEEITIFPNPTSSFITIHIKEGIAIEEVIIYNHLGQKVLVAVPENNTVDVLGLKPGIYFLEVITSESRAGTKLVIE
jgi:hypothetical protein